MGLPSYKRPVVDRNVVMRRMTLLKCELIWDKVYSKECLRTIILELKSLRQCPWMTLHRMLYEVVVPARTTLRRTMTKLHVVDQRQTKWKTDKRYLHLDDDGDQLEGNSKIWSRMFGLSFLVSRSAARVATELVKARPPQNDSMTRISAFMSWNKNLILRLVSGISA